MNLFKSLLERTPSVAEVDQAREQLLKRQQEVEARRAEINPDDMQAGPTKYHQALRDGTPEEVQKLEREFELLNIERRQIEHRLVELQPVRAKAEAAEAAKALPGHIKALPAMLDDYDKALAALNKARARVDNQISLIHSARRAMDGNGRDVPAVPERIIERISDMKGFTEPDSVHRYSGARQLLYRDLAGDKSPRYRGDDDPKKGKYKRGVDRQGTPDPAAHPEHGIVDGEGAQR
ncbi:MAG: hypothetical protein V2J19_04075 [Wenzhouxiangella sp.]|jgi:hypothetical protein|nr:hypothetical protein [Wenzhouxiangella sp.]